MHDPKVVAFEIRRPWPQRSRGIPGSQTRPRWSVGSAFWTAAGRMFYWPSVITVWHVEPGDSDAFSVCKHAGHWKWHVHHWQVTIRPLQRFKSWAWTRCEGCGRRTRAETHVTGSWGSGPARWFRSPRGIWHDDCRALAHLRVQHEEDGEHLLYLIDRITGGDPGSRDKVLQDLYDRSHTVKADSGYKRRRRIETLLDWRDAQAAAHS